MENITPAKRALAVLDAPATGRTCARAHPGWSSVSPGSLRFQRNPEDDEGSQAVAIASDRVDLDHGLLMRRDRHHDDTEGTEASEALPSCRQSR